jgi:hypothetical protein
MMESFILYPKLLIYAQNRQLCGLQGKFLKDGALAETYRGLFEKELILFHHSSGLHFSLLAVVRPNMLLRLNTQSRKDHGQGIFFLLNVVISNITNCFILLLLQSPRIIICRAYYCLIPSSKMNKSLRSVRLITRNFSKKFECKCSIPPTHFFDLNDTNDLLGA